ncbi:SPOR domain-containing protein [Sphingopyxis sp.]|uniref:SPOR domain-containing protein n=1 Tax=Sphingopyxis sp. TaxID=1908224 RepID=UPI003D112225
MRSFRAAAFLALPLLALAAPAHADVKDGVEAWQAGDYPKAVAEWRPLAVSGDADAQFNLGQAYKLGRGVPADLTQAEDWYRRAAKQGHLQAEDNLGLILFTANKRDEAMPYIKASADRGEPRAQYVLGTAMFNGDYAAKDWARAYALTKRASDAGLGIASARLAQLDSLIPLDQRQAGLALIPVMEKDEARARLAAVNAAAPPAPAKPAPSPIKTASLPVSAPGASYTPPPVIAPAKPAPALATPAAVAAATAATEATAAATAAKGSTAPGTSYAAPPENGALPPKKAEPKPAPAKPKPAFDNQPIKVVETPVPADTVTGTSPWRAQLGAFGVEANARSLWASLGKKYPAVAARQPVYVKAGAVTRLQTAGFANKGHAENFCATVRKGGQACMVVAK